MSYSLTCMCGHADWRHSWRGTHWCESDDCACDGYMPAPAGEVPPTSSRPAGATQTSTEARSLNA